MYWCCFSPEDWGHCRKGKSFRVHCWKLTSLALSIVHLRWENRSFHFQQTCLRRANKRRVFHKHNWSIEIYEICLRLGRFRRHKQLVRQKTETAIRVRILTETLTSYKKVLRFPYFFHLWRAMVVTILKRYGTEGSRSLSGTRLSVRIKFNELIIVFSFISWLMLQCEVFKILLITVQGQKFKILNEDRSSSNSKIYSTQHREVYSNYIRNRLPTCFAITLWEVP